MDFVPEVIFSAFLDQPILPDRARTQVENSTKAALFLESPKGALSESDTRSVFPFFREGEISIKCYCLKAKQQAKV